MRASLGLVMLLGVAHAEPPAVQEAPSAPAEAPQLQQAPGGAAARAGQASRRKPATEVDPLLRAVELPVAAVEARQAGYAPDEVRGVIEASRTVGMTAGNAAGLLRRLSRASVGGRPVPGLAEVARSQLQAGVRGKALVDAIDRARAEARGAAGEAPRAAPGGRGGRPGAPGGAAKRGKGKGGKGRPGGRPPGDELGEEE